MQNTTHDNHYVAQATLRRWSADGNRVYAYRVLVSRPEVPEWALRSIRGLAFQPDLYTSLVGGKEADEFEHWIQREFEDPGLKAIDRLLGDAHMTPTEWRSIARFVASQDVRTPLNFIEFMRLCGKATPTILDDCVKDFVQYRQQSVTQADAVEFRPNPHPFAESLRVHVHKEPNSDNSTVRVEVATPRKLWLASMRQILTGVADVLCEHRWSIAIPHGSEEWPLTDHPVLRLNYYDREQYDFGGGWGNTGSEVMMPISPKHLLYVQVGKKAQNRFAFSSEHTQIVQRLIAERSHRWVFARHPAAWITKVKPRVVDQAAFDAEQDGWERWRKDQLDAEAQIPAAKS